MGRGLHTEASPAGTSASARLPISKGSPPPSLGGRPGPVPSRGAQRWSAPLRGPCSARTRPPDAIAWFWVRAHTSKTVSCRRQAGVRAGGPEGDVGDVCHRAGSPDTAPSADGGAHRAHGNDFYCNMTIPMDDLQPLIFIPITAAGILIC